MTIVAHRDWEFENPLVLVGFPSQGLVGSVAASYLVPLLDMELVATLHSDRLPPVASVRAGRAVSPVQVYASTYRCGLDGECDQLVVVRADAAPDAQHIPQVAREILEWCNAVDASLVVCLEGANPQKAGESVHAVQNLISDLDTSALDVEVTEQGGLGGIAASLLVQGNHRGLPVLTLFTGVEEDEQADAAAAARLLNIADPLVPGVRMEPETLMEKAGALADTLKKDRQEQRDALERAQEEAHPHMMYR